MCATLHLSMQNMPPTNMSMHTGHLVITLNIRITMQYANQHE